MAIEEGDCAVNVDAKYEFATERMNKRLAARSARRCHRRCFWTRPLGHKWKYVGGWHDECVGCGKTRWND